MKLIWKWCEFTFNRNEIYIIVWIKGKKYHQFNLNPEFWVWKSIQKRLFLV